MSQFVWDCQALRAGFSPHEGVIEDINLIIKEGEKVALLGGDLSGRDMLLRVLCGLRPLREGNFSVLGNQLEKLPYFADWDRIFKKSIRNKMGVALEREGLLSNVSVQEGLELLYNYKYLRDPSALVESGITVDTLLKEFGLHELRNQRPHQLNSTQKRLACLARAFLTDPQILVLENPSHSVSDLSRSLLNDALKKFVFLPNKTVLLSTDDWLLARKFCDRWVVMSDGKIIFDGSFKEGWKSDLGFFKRARESFDARKQELKEVSEDAA